MIEIPLRNEELLVKREPFQLTPSIRGSADEKNDVTLSKSHGRSTLTLHAACHRTQALVESVITYKLKT
jgi:hypothetical protein